MVRFEPVASRTSLTGQLAWFGAWAVVTLVAMGLHPDPHLHGTHTQLGLPPCYSVLLFGRPCPGCGLTTSFCAVAHGNLPLAFQAHPFGPIMYALFTVSAFAALGAWLRRRRLNTNTKGFNWAISLFVLAFLAFGAFRFATVSGLGWNTSPLAVRASASR